MSDITTTNNFLKNIRNKIYDKDPSNVMLEYGKKLETQITKVEDVIKKISVINKNNLSKISNKDSKFKVNVNHTLDPYTFHTRTNSRHAVVYNDITKYGSINLKLDRMTTSEFNEINLTNPGENDGIWVLYQSDKLYYAGSNPGRTYTKMNDNWIEAGDDGPTYPDNPSFNAMRYVAYNILNIFALIKQVNIIKNQQQVANNVLNVLDIKNVKAPISLIKKTKETLPAHGAYEICIIEENHFKKFLEELTKSLGSKRLDPEQWLSSLETDPARSINDIVNHPDNKAKIIMEGGEFGVFNTKSTSQNFNKSRMEYVSYLKRLLSKLRSSQTELLKIESFGDLFAKKFTDMKEEYKLQISLYNEEYEEYQSTDRTAKRTKKMIKKKNQDLILKDLKDNIENIEKSVKIYMRTRKKLSSLEKGIMRKRNLISNKNLNKLRTSTSDVEYIKYDIAYHAIVLFDKLDILATTTPRIYRVNRASITNKVLRFLPQDIRRLLRLRKTSPSGFRGMMTRDLGVATMDYNINNNNRNSLTLVNAFSSVNNYNNNVNIRRRDTLTVDGRKLFIPYTRMRGGFIKENGILDLSELYHTGKIVTYSRVDVSIIRRQLYDRAYLIVNSHEEGLNSSAKWKVLELDKVRAAFNSRDPRIYRRTVFRLVTSIAFYTQNTVNWLKGEDLVKTSIVRFCKSTSPRFSRCDFIKSLDELNI